MKNQITPLLFEGITVRTSIVDDAIYFCAKDFASLLGYANHKEAIKDNCDDTTSKLIEVEDSLGRVQQAKFINEDNIWKLILCSRLEKAKAIKHWMATEVLPQLRKKNHFSIEKPINPSYLEKIQEKKELNTQERLEKIKEFTFNHQIKSFDFEGCLIRNIEHNGKIYYCLKDIASLCGYKQERDAIIEHCNHDNVLDLSGNDGGGKGGGKKVTPYFEQDQNNHLTLDLSGNDGGGSSVGKKVTHTFDIIIAPFKTLGGIQNIKFGSKGNCLRLLDRCTLEVGKKFRDWMIDDVTVSVLETGSYTLPQAEPKQEKQKSASILREERLQAQEDRLREKMMLEDQRLREEMMLRIGEQKVQRLLALGTEAKIVEAVHNDFLSKNIKIDVSPFQLALPALNSYMLLTASQIAKALGIKSAIEVNKILCELGFLKRDIESEDYIVTDQGAEYCVSTVQAKSHNNGSLWSGIQRKWKDGIVSILKKYILTK